MKQRSCIFLFNESVCLSLEAEGGGSTTNSEERRRNQKCFQLNGRIQVSSESTKADVSQGEGVYWGYGSSLVKVSLA